MSERFKSRIEHGSLEGLQFIKTYTTQTGREEYKIFPGDSSIGPSFSVFRGFLGVGWRWEGRSHNRRDLQPFWQRGFQLFKKSAIIAATHAAIFHWEAWESSRAGRSIIR